MFDYDVVVLPFSLLYVTRLLWLFSACVTSCFYYASMVELHTLLLCDVLGV